MLNQDHVASFYAERLPPRAPRAPLEGATTADVAVVGGGLAGLTTAHCLATGGISAVLVEANRLGWGASGRNGGFVSPGYAASIFELESRLGRAAARELYSLSREGVALVRARMADSGIAGEIGGRGWLKVIRHRNTDALRRRALRMAKDYGAEQAFWPGDRVRDVLRTGRYFAGLHDPEPFHIDPLAYAEALGRAAAEAGARLYEGTRATALGRRGCWQIETRNGDGGRGRIEAEHVVLATGADGHGLWAAIDRAILPVATYVVTTNPLGSRLDDAIRFGGCIADTRRAGDYYRIVGKGADRRLLWGGRITTRRGAPPDLVARLARDIRGVYPQLFAAEEAAGGLVIDRAWSGLMGYTTAKMPIIGRIGEGLWACAAFGGHGLNTTAIGGLLVADAIRCGDERWKAFRPFHPGLLDRLIGGPGPLGQAVTQLSYWGMQARDRLDEVRSPPARIS